MPKTYINEKNADKQSDRLDSQKNAFAKQKIDWSSLDLNKVKTIIRKDNGLAIWDALAMAREKGKIIVPNIIHDRMLIETDRAKENAIIIGYGAWTGTAIIYEAPDVAFRDEVIFKYMYNGNMYAIKFDVPEKFRGKKNCALAVNHPDFDVLPMVGKINYLPNMLMCHKLVVGDDINIRLIENFPKESGWYYYDEETRIPVGKPLSYKKDVYDIKNRKIYDTVRLLWRMEEAYCGIIARDNFTIFGPNSIYVSMLSLPNFNLGVHAISLTDVLRIIPMPSK